MKILFENKQLNEGPGAGYTVSGTIKNVRVNAIKNHQIVSQGNGYAEYLVDIDAVADFVDVYAESYYYSGKIQSTPISISRVSVELEEGKITNDEVKYAIEGTKILANLGGGWIHSTFDGIIDTDWKGIEDSYAVSEIRFVLTDSNAVKYLDRAVVDGNTETLYAVMENNWVEEAFETEDEAIEFAKKHGYDSVQIIYETEHFNGDVDTKFGDVVWEAVMTEKNT